MRRQQLLAGSWDSVHLGAARVGISLPQLTPVPGLRGNRSKSGRAVKRSRWHSVVIEGDSISGVSFVQAPDCDSCRGSVPLDDVDSVRVGNPVAGFLKTLGLVVGVPALLLVIACAEGPGGPPCSE